MFFFLNVALKRYRTLVNSDHHKSHKSALLMPIGRSVFSVFVSKGVVGVLCSVGDLEQFCYVAVFLGAEEWSLCIGCGLHCVKIASYGALLSNTFTDGVTNMQHCQIQQLTQIDSINRQTKLTLLFLWTFFWNYIINKYVRATNAFTITPHVEMVP